MPVTAFVSEAFQRGSLRAARRTPGVIQHIPKKKSN